MVYGALRRSRTLGQPMNAMWWAMAGKLCSARSFAGSIRCWETSRHHSAERTIRSSTPNTQTATWQSLPIGSIDASIWQPWCRVCCAPQLQQNRSRYVYCGCLRHGANQVGQCQQRHTHVEWLKFLKQIDKNTPKDKTLHLIADNYATHKHPKVQEWLTKHPRFNMHFTPTSASWLNMVERFFRDITTDRLRRGVFTSVSELEDAITQYIAHHNQDPKPFIWTKSARDILQKVIRANSKLSSKKN